MHWVIAELKPNVDRYYSEMTEGDDYGPPDVDWDMYESASRSGQCRVVTVRDNGKLIGFSIFVISTNQRYKNRIEANSDGIFLEKPYRGQLSKALLNKSDEYLQAIGVHETNYTLSDDRIGRMLPGYKSTYKVWSKKYGQ